MRMTASKSALALLAPALALSTGCAESSVLCQPCPPPALVSIDAPRQPAGTILTWCSYLTTDGTVVFGLAD